MSPTQSPKHINLMQPYVPPGAIEAVTDTLRSRWIGQGPKCDEFERRFSELVGGRQCLAVGSCTDALHLAYLLAGIGPGDEVIAPVFTCTATNIPLLWLGADIKFADVEPSSLNVNPWAVQDLITDRTKAIVTVHYGGTPAKLYPSDIPIIEDCAQALGGKFKNGTPIGSHGEFGCFSFQAVKHVTTGDGGMLVLPDELADKARRMRWFGIDRKAKLNGTWANDIYEVGYKYQLTDIGAAMGLAGLDSLDGQLEHRRFLMMTYVRGLSGIAGISLIMADPDGAAWLCTVLVERREDFRRKLAECGIESDQVHYRNDRYSIFAKFRGEFPNMDAIDSKYLCLPLHMGMTVEDVDYVCGVIRSGW
jgi:dTDP-4-amino-4,6-dideoxygalactose transaminase